MLTPTLTPTLALALALTLALDKLSARVEVRPLPVLLDAAKQRGGRRLLAAPLLG